MAPGKKGLQKTTVIIRSFRQQQAWVITDKHRNEVKHF